MAKTTVGGRARGGAARQRSVAAAARAAGKRAERAERLRGEAATGVVAGRTVRVGIADPLPAPDEPEAEATDRPGKPDAPGRPDAAGRPEAPGKPAARKAPRKSEAPATPDTGAASGTAARRRGGRLRGRPGLFRALPAAVTVAAVAATAFLGWEYLESERTRAARTEAAAAARKAAPDILSYDHRHLEKDFAEAREHLTGEFLAKFEKTTASVVTPTAKEYDGVVKATVAKPPAGGAPAVSVVSASPDEVVVLLFMNQVTESTKLSKPRLDLNRVRMTMVDTPDGGWKVSTLNAL